MGASSFLLQNKCIRIADWMSDGLARSRYVSGVGTNQLGNAPVDQY